jgi:hypothetical protein
LKQLAPYAQKLEGLANGLTEKGGKFASGMASMFAQSFDGVSGLPNKLGTKMGGLANLGKDNLNRLTNGMQNFLPSSMGGSLPSKAGEFAKSIIPSNIAGPFKQLNPAQMFQNMPSQVTNIVKGQGIPFSQDLFKAMGPNFKSPSSLNAKINQAKDKIMSMGQQQFGGMKQQAMNAFNNVGNTIR